MLDFFQILAIICQILMELTNVFRITLVNHLND
jgi:hypothetical protein